MKRILVLLLLLCVLFSSCADKTVIENSSTYTEEEQSESHIGGMVPSGEYVANTSTKKYHTQFCGMVANMSEENMLLTYDIKALTDKGYTPCSMCIARTAD